ncbi:CDP-alcohol phosphatidyltransferase family protein [Alicyclobacillus acidiphilus]|uniref:CDP-alcohol phosphatidyltransferase family protein n=1 Tax=Alicyclobacillus acidiphilus TaxID=182455 RepID=UPI00082C8281|nr:CDP-alcohol phosphatidyltransferase family protein [Alicyclobacillus acidiphilus]
MPTSELSRINDCAKRPIDIWTNYLYYPLSIRLVYILRKTPVTPNELTLLSMFICFVGCVFWGFGGRDNLSIGLLFVQLSYVIDCADGQLARYKKMFSSIGGWLDQVSDRVKEFAIYFSLAYGYTRTHGTEMWIWKWTLIALFTLYLLEYLAQIQPKPRHGVDVVAVGASGNVPPSHEQYDGQRADLFARAQKWRGFVPFRGFIIGEQYFAQLVFLAFGAIVPFFHFVSFLGLAMCVYRPLVQFYKLNRGR